MSRAATEAAREQNCSCICGARSSEKNYKYVTSDPRQSACGEKKLNASTGQHVFAGKAERDERKLSVGKGSQTESACYGFALTAD